MPYQYTVKLRLARDDARDIFVDAFKEPFPGGAFHALIYRVE